MEKLRFKFAVLGASDGKTNVICIMSIETPDGCTFEIPDEFKPASKHTAIFSSDVFTKIRASLKKRHQTRSIWIPLTEDLKKTYLDEGENVQFGDQYLNEITEKTNSFENNNRDTNPEKKNIGKTAEKFLIEKFSNKTSSADQWLDEFEGECDRFDIKEDQDKIGILKHLLEKQCLDWYSSMLIKLTVNSEWTEWKANFCETYGKKGWSQVKYAFTFRYKTGSLLEYATRKERLLLEVNKNIDTPTMINLIVIGLPDYIIDKIDKEEVKSTSNLYNEIGRYEHTANKKSFIKKWNTNETKGKSDKILPCKTCENLNKGTRFHPEDKCWFKQTEDNKNKTKSYYNKAVNNAMIDVELNNDKKNE
ncbi:uncharacterized protein LOC125226205 [Leguminivora glycinivorella]|uniref:uncharacterized protein LOC125226205 n=1 Tax=Leguminivora glycinivorella TaxID=1035111 RepID=UPI00200D199D|nr:uncharacterized protein LOC125226205 [Leguminivora glycinivorella]